MIDRHPWILLVAGTTILGTVLLGIAFGAPPVVDDLFRYLVRPRAFSIGGVLAFAYVWHRTIVGLGNALDRRRARIRAAAIMARHDHRNA